MSKRCDSFQEARNWLNQYREQVRFTDLLTERAATLEAQASAPRTAQLDGMPHSPNRASDPVGAAVAKLEELKTSISTAREQERRLYRERDAAISEISGKNWPEMQTALRLRYLDFAEWADVNFSLFGSKEDFSEREESYLRRTFKLHSDAMARLTKTVFFGEKEENT